METLINWYVKISGLWAKMVDLLPLLGAVGSILGVGASICSRAATSTDAGSLWQAIHPTAHEMASVSLAVGLLKAHFNHQENKALLTKPNVP